MHNVPIFEELAEDVRPSQVTAIMLGVRDMGEAMWFYTGRLGLKAILQQKELALLQCGTVMLGLSTAHARGLARVPETTEVVFRVSNVRAAHRTLTARGVSFLGEPRQVTPADWAAHFRDPDGHLLSIFGPEGQA